MNSTKIYGSDSGPWLSRGISTEHAIQTFCRNITGGFASSRFHRPPTGLGLSQPSINSLITIRKIEEKVRMWDIDPRMDLLGGAGENNAFLSAREGESYVIYFTGPTTVTLDLRAYDIPFIIDWIEIEKADWVKSASIAGGRIVKLSSEYPGGAFAVLTLQKKRK